MLQDNLSSSRSSRQDLNSNNEVALDIGSIAAAGDTCIDKVVMVSGKTLTLIGLGLIKINTVLANFNNPRPSLTLDN